MGDIHGYTYIVHGAYGATQNYKWLATYHQFFFTSGWSSVCVSWCSVCAFGAIRSLQRRIGSRTSRREWQGTHCSADAGRSAVTFYILRKVALIRIDVPPWTCNEDEDEEAAEVVEKDPPAAENAAAAADAEACWSCWVGSLNHRFNLRRNPWGSTLHQFLVFLHVMMPQRNGVIRWSVIQ